MIIIYFYYYFILFFFVKEIKHIKKTYVCLFYPHGASWVFPLSLILCCNF